MDVETFDRLLELVTTTIQKKETVMRKSISPAVRLAVTLRFLATGDSSVSLSRTFLVSPSSISIFVPEVCDAIYTALKDTYMKV